MPIGADPAGQDIYDHLERLIEWLKAKHCELCELTTYWESPERPRLR